ncbi:hypothetical protein LSH36_435g03052, partial [Paralvinella palmiformis]
MINFNQQQRDTMPRFSTTHIHKIYISCLFVCLIIRYMLAYFTVIGCGDPEIPYAGWLKRNGNEAEIGCKHSKTTWRLTCEHNKWMGTYGNCTGGKAAGVFGDVTWGKHTIPF